MGNSLRECFEEGLLKKIRPNLNYSEQSIRQAEHFLDEAESLINSGIKDMAFIALYNASFHAARAILFRDGIKERSHYCVCKYIEEIYHVNELVTMQQSVILDSLRSKRNDIQYSLEQPELEEDIGEIFSEVTGFIERVKEIIKNGKKPVNTTELK
ncbi:MAG TPA: HEPN domain-containing protein [Candidatus Diapherotrites archaeon]|uniref:HEPN domain-containing protein n=1 Tax=Candidatus Iainarchaeum sp. TaxID=3101447 RepID=A0A7J4IY69_9ARCH|nr:HEPN domain-containing protein [Candidatus Diapherotrites archaeon]